ncbi:MAG: hypothetical protein ABFS32_00650 [Bacteroidota bacterium]
MKYQKPVWVIALLVLLVNLQSVKAQEKQSLFIDTLDNAFDVSHFLLDLHGLLPVVSPITEPAVGYGATVALMYFIPKKDKKARFQMPDIVTAMGGLTQNNTWFAGGGYIGFWKDDRVRYRAMAGYADVNLKYYGTGNSFLGENPASFSINSYVILQQVIARLGESNFFIGGKYLFMKTNVSAFEDSKLPFVRPLDFDLTSSGVSFITEYEKYDNVLSPSEGLRVHLRYHQNIELIGSDRNYGRLTFFSLFYIPVTDRWVPGFRFESLLTTGDPPFYAKPFVGLRGVPAMRYQGELTVLAETEHSFSLTNRWSLIGFAGVGTAYDNLTDMNHGDIAWNAGGGFRYLMARLLGIKMGVDVARGPEDWAFYVVFGSSWMR